MGYLIQRQLRKNLRSHWPLLGPGDHTELLVLYALADHADEGDAAKGASVEQPGGTRQCYPSIRTLTEQGVASRRQVQRALQSLQHKGYITTTPHPVHSTNVYTVVDMVAGAELIDQAMSTATMSVATRLGLTPDEARAKLTTLVGAFERAHMADHDGCLPVPQVTADAINDLAMALVTKGASRPADGLHAVPEVGLRVVSEGVA